MKTKILAFLNLTAPLILILSAVTLFLLILTHRFDPSIALVEKEKTWEKKHNEKFTRSQEIPVLLYHNIEGKGDFSIPQYKLKEQFSYLKNNGYQVIPLDTFANDFSSPDQKGVVLTFDDDYPAMYRYLLPLVYEYHFPVTLFVYIDGITNGRGGGLSWGDLHDLELAGVEIESHSKSHADLVALYDKGDEESEQKLFEEIYLSKRVLELYLHKEIDYFAFPYGKYNLGLIDLCKLAGYKRVFSTDYGPNILTRNNYCLRRHHIKNSYTLEYFSSIVK